MYRGYRNHKEEDQARTAYLIQQQMLFDDEDDGKKKTDTQSRPQREKTPEEIAFDKKLENEAAQFVGVFLLTTVAVILVTWFLEILHLQMLVSVMKVILGKWLLVWFILMLVFSFSSKFKAKFLTFADKFYARLGRVMSFIFSKFTRR